MLVLGNGISIGMTTPMLPFLVRAMTRDPSIAYWWVGTLAAAFALMQLLASTFMGALSDSRGRRPVLLVSMGGMIFDYLVMAMAPAPGWLLAARLAGGITSATMATAGACIGDAMPDSRVRALGVLNAAFAGGLILGTATGGFLASVDARLPYWVAAMLMLAAFVHAALNLDETLGTADRKTLSCVDIAPWASLKIIRSDALLSRWTLVMLFSLLGQQAITIAIPLYLVTRFGSGPMFVGFMLAAIGISTIALQGFLMGGIADRLGNRNSVFVGSCLGTIGMAVLAFAPTPGTFLFGVPFLAGSALIFPNVQGAMLGRVASCAVGRLQGAYATIMAAAGLIGPPILSGLTMVNTPGLVALPFVFAALMFLAAFLIAVSGRHWSSSEPASP